MVLIQSEDYECTCTVKTFHSKIKEKFSRYWNLLPKQRQHCTTTTVSKVLLIGQICMDLTKYVLADMVLSCIEFNND